MIFDAVLEMKFPNGTRAEKTLTMQADMSQVTELKPFFNELQDIIMQDNKRWSFKHFINANGNKI